MKKPKTKSSGSLTRLVSRRIASEIAADLLTEGGTNKKAKRLALEMPGFTYNEASGWCEAAIRDVILKHLKAANND